MAYNVLEYLMIESCDDRENVTTLELVLKDWPYVGASMPIRKIDQKTKAALVALDQRKKLSFISVDEHVCQFVELKVTAKKIKIVVQPLQNVEREQQDWQICSLAELESHVI